MAVGILLLMSEGLMAYRNPAAVRVFSDIMTGTNREKARSLHMGLQLSAAAFVVLGTVFILVNKLRYGKSLLPASIHALVGTVALGLLALQVGAGLAKVASPTPVHRYHGDLGLLTYDAFVLAVVTGCMRYLPWGFANSLVTALVPALWLATSLQMRGMARPDKSEQLLEMTAATGGAGDHGADAEGLLAGGGGGGGGSLA